MRLQHRLGLALGLFTLAVMILFALFAMGFSYAVEDHFIQRGLQQEVARLQSQGGAPRPGYGLHAGAASLPPAVATLLAQEPMRREFAGDQGRHYHLQSLNGEGAPWLLAEVSDQLVVRPMRAEMLAWLGAWGAGLLLLAGALGLWLARRIAQPLQQLSRAAQAATPEALPVLPGRERDDEIGELARRFDALLARTRDFIAREQAFSAEASHELRTPLAVLRIGLDAEGAPPLRAAVRQMQQTLDALLLLARESSSQPGHCAPLPLVEAWVLAQAPLLDARGLRVSVRLQRSDRIALPELLLQPVLTSLLANALAHADAGGCIEIERQGEGLRIANPGLGEGGGDGLGLPLVRRLLARQGATLTFTQGAGRSEVRVLPGHADPRGR